MASRDFSDLMGEINSKLGLVTNNMSEGVSNFVVPLGFLLMAIGLLMYSLLLMEGKTNKPFVELLSKGVVVLLILMACGVYYGPWVSDVIAGLPVSLMAALGQTGDPITVLDVLAGNLTDLITGIAAGAIDAFVNWNIGGGLLLVVAMIDIIIVGSALLVACVFNVLYSMLGLHFMRAVGPIFILCLMTAHLKNYFYSWLNTVLYFVFLAVMATVFVVFFIGVAQMFMDRMQKLIMDMTAAGGAMSYPQAIGQAIKAWATGAQAPASVGAAKSNFLNIVRLMMSINLVFIPMVWVVMELRTMVSSMTNGGGGSAGGSVGRIANFIRS